MDQFVGAMSNLIQQSPNPQTEQHHLDPIDSGFNPSAVDGGGHYPVPPPLCSSCGRRPPPRSAATPMKRRSPTPFQDPNPTTKKLFLDPTSFSKIHLPIPFGPSPADPTSFSPLCRSVSDPTNFSSDKTIKEESPDSKRVRRMKDRLKEMNEWWNEVMSEEENREDRKKRKELEDDEEETVGVERVGDDSLELRLKCPCGKGFEILLSGKTCFYKLI